MGHIYDIGLQLKRYKKKRKNHKKFCLKSKIGNIGRKKQISKRTEAFRYSNSHIKGMGRTIIIKV